MSEKLNFIDLLANLSYGFVCVGLAIMTYIEK